MELNQKNVRTILLLITFGIVLYALVQNLGVIYAALSRVWKVLSTVITGFGLAFALNVPLRVVEGKIFGFMGKSRAPWLRRLQRPVSLITTLLATFGVVTLIILFILPQLSVTLTGLMEKFPEYVKTATNWVEETLRNFKLVSEGLPEFTIDWDKTFSALSGFITGGSDGLINKATTVTASVINTALSAIFSLVIAIYILAQKEQAGLFARRVLVLFLPEKASKQILRIAALSDEVFSNFIAGQLLEACILAVLCYIGMLIMRFPYPEIIAVIIGVTSLVPMVGAFIGELLGAFLILFVSPIKALLFIVFILCLQQLEGSLIYPRVVGKSVGVPGVLVLCAVIVGGKISGVLGALLGVPVCAVIYALIREAIEVRTAKMGPGSAESEKAGAGDSDKSAGKAEKT